MARLFTDNASALITNTLGTGTTGIIVTTGKGALFPSPVSPDYAILTLTQAGTETSWEKVLLTSRTADSLVVQRGWEGSTPLSWAIGDKIELRLTAPFLNESAYKNVPQVSKSVAYRAVLSDAGKHIFHPSSDATARIFEIPATASVNYDIGTTLTFINQLGAGVITIQIVGSGSTDFLIFAGTALSGNRTLAANGIATAVKITYNTWMITGVGLS